MQRQALRRIEARALLLDCVQRRDAPQCLLGDRTTAGGVHVEELAPDMGQASQFGAAVGKQLSGPVDAYFSDLTKCVILA